MEISPENCLRLFYVVGYLRLSSSLYEFNIGLVVLHIIVLMHALDLLMTFVSVDPLADLALHLFQAHILELIQKVLLRLREHWVLRR